MIRITAILGLMLFAPGVLADTVFLKPDLPAARLAQIEAQIAPAKLFVERNPVKPIPMIRGRILSVTPSPDHEQWVMTFRAWWRTQPNEKVKWSTGAVRILRSEVRGVAIEFDSLYGLRYALSDRDLTSGPMGSDAWLRRMLRLFDPEGSLGLALESSAPESPAELGAVKLDSYLLQSIRSRINFRRLTPAELLEENKELANPLHWKTRTWDLAPRILNALAFENEQGTIEPEYRQAAEKALAFFAYLARAKTREEFSFGTIDPDNPAANEVPDAEQFAVGVQATGYRANLEVFQALQVATADEIQINSGGVFTPDAAQIRVEPTEVAYVALDIIEREPAFWLLKTENDEHRESFAREYLDLIVSVAAPAWVESPLVPQSRLRERRQYGGMATTAGFVRQRGNWTPLQIRARETAIRLMFPDYDAPLIQTWKARAQLRVSAATFQKSFCHYLMVGGLNRDGTEANQFIERVLIEFGKTQRAIPVPCLEDIFSTLTGYADADPNAPHFLAARRKSFPTFLIIAALYSGRGAIFPETEVGKQFDKRLDELISATGETGRAGRNEFEFVRHLAAIGGYVISSRRDWSEATARTAIEKAISTIRTSIVTESGDAAQVKIRDFVVTRTERVPRMELTYNLRPSRLSRKN